MYAGRKRGADGRLLLEAGSGRANKYGDAVLRISLCEHSSGVRVVSEREVHRRWGMRWHSGEWGLRADAKASDQPERLENDLRSDRDGAVGPAQNWVAQVPLLGPGKVRIPQGNVGPTAGSGCPTLAASLFLRLEHFSL